MSVILELFYPGILMYCDISVTLHIIAFSLKLPVKKDKNMKLKIVLIVITKE